MKCWMRATVVALSAGLFFGSSGAGFTSAATTQPSDAAAPSTLPSASANPAKFPTPAELIAQMKATHKSDEGLPKVAYFDLEGQMPEKPADFSWFAGDESEVTLRVLLDRLEKARQDPSIRGILITLSDAGLNLSQAMELRDELTALRHDGKKTFVYADAYDTTGYIAASGATDVCILEGGEIMIPGVGFETMFAKGLLDKLGVDADYVQIGEYKGADEMYTRSTASDELRGQLNHLSESLYNQIIDAISLSRNMTRADVKSLVDDSLIPAKIAKNRGMVDHLVDADGLRSLMKDELGEKIDLVADYGEAPREDVDLSSPFAFFSLLSRKPAAITKPGVAIIYAEGEIVDGGSGGGLFGDSGHIGSADLREALRIASRDDKVKAIVLRIDSPGGSALASEVMWQAARRVAKTKPLIISVGSMAASGGYYLASSGDFIFADPTAIVGSIGVVGGKFVMKDLYAKLGITTESFMQGRNADLFSSSTEWDDRQRRQVTNWMKETYDQFTERVMTTRQGKIKDIDSVARGRIFSAKQAADLGMVDQIGGLQDAIAYAAKKADLNPGNYDVRVLPAPKTLSDILSGGASDPQSANPFTPKTGLQSLGILDALPTAERQAVTQELDMMMLLQKSPVALTSPFVLVVK